MTGIPTLFVEINDLNYIFVVGKYDENQNLKIIEKIITPNEGIEKNILVIISPGTRRHFRSAQLWYHWSILNEY